MSSISFVWYLLSWLDDIFKNLNYPATIQFWLISRFYSEKSMSTKIKCWRKFRHGIVIDLKAGRLKQGFWISDLNTVFWPLKGYFCRSDIAQRLHWSWPWFQLYHYFSNICRLYPRKQISLPDSVSLLF